MNRTRMIILLALCTVFKLSGGAFAQDAAGAGDHPLVGRYAGSEITFHETRAYDEIALPDRIVPAGQNRAPAAWSLPLAGAVTSLRYDGPAGRSGLEVMRNYQQALEAGGFETIMFCVRAACVEQGSLSSFWDAARGGIGMPTRWESSIYLLARNGGVYVGLLSVETGSDTAVTPHVALTVVETGDMEDDQIVLVEASAIEAAFAKDGRIAVYGIYFDFDAAVLKPESAPQIAELARLLTENENLDVVIVGHTDSIGDFDYNLTLSQQRAQAVVDVLISKYDISRSRLTPAGAGMVAPVSTNRTDAGRALNRRVEIVELYSSEE